MRKTEHYQLNLWDAEDAILREDFNADNEKIEAALADIVANGLKIATGSYVGTGRYNNTYTSLTFPFAPKLLIVQNSTNADYRMIYPVGAESTLVYNRGDSTYPVRPVVTGNTIKWLSTYGSQYQLNTENQTYYWVALG